MTSDAKHVEIGLTDKSDSARWIFADLWRRGIGPGRVLIAGDEFGPLGGLTGSDSFLLVPEAVRATAVSVGAEPTGRSRGIVRRCLAGPRPSSRCSPTSATGGGAGTSPMSTTTRPGRSTSTASTPGSSASTSRC